MVAFLRREYSGGGATTALSASMSSSDVTFAIVNATGWPGSPAANFMVVIDRGTPAEEKILCSANASTTVTVANRGYDGTSAAAHSSGATVSLCAGAIDFDEANQITNLLGNGTSGYVLEGGGAGTLPTWNTVPSDSTKLPLAGGTMSGAIAMGSHKITGLTNGSGAQDAAAFGQLPAAAVPLSTVTTAGDLIYGTGSATVSRLGIGSAGKVLTVNAGATAPEWDVVAAGVTLAAPFVATSGTPTWTPSTTGSAIFRALIVGGGGGGGAASATVSGDGGGGGEVRDVYLGNVTGTQTITIPAASAAGVAGGNVTIGALATALGGGAGGAQNVGVGGVGGDGSTGYALGSAYELAGSAGGASVGSAATGQPGGSGYNRYGIGGGAGGGPTSGIGGISGGGTGVFGAGGTGAALGGGGGGAGVAVAGTNGSAGVGGKGAAGSANSGAGGGGGGAGTTPGAGGAGGTGYVIIYQVA